LLAGTGELALRLRGQLGGGQEARSFAVTGRAWQKKSTRLSGAVYFQCLDMDSCMLPGLDNGCLAVWKGIQNSPVKIVFPAIPPLLTEILGIHCVVCGSAPWRGMPDIRPPSCFFTIGGLLVLRRNSLIHNLGRCDPGDV